MNSLHYYSGRLKAYYEIIGAVSLRNVKLRYKNSILGFLWTLINPLIYLTIFIFIFKNAFPDIENYPLYAITGLIIWTFFSGTSTQIMNSIIDSGGILKSLGVPPIIFPISYLISSMINFLLSLIPFFILMVFFGFQPKAESLLLFPGLLLFGMFTFGFSLLLCSFNVFFRDVSMFYNTIMPALFYFTPIAYSFNLVPEKAKVFVKLNPIFHYIEFFRDTLYYGRTPSLSTSLIACVLSVLFTSLGIYTFNKLKRGFISHL